MATNNTLTASPELLALIEQHFLGQKEVSFVFEEGRYVQVDHCKYCNRYARVWQPAKYLINNEAVTQEEYYHLLKIFRDPSLR